MNSRSRRIVVILILLLLALLALLLFARCSPKVTPAPAAAVAPATPPPPSPAVASAPAITVPTVTEHLSAATVQVPAQVAAGTTFRAGWTGPNNPGDYLTVVRPGAVPASYANYQETRLGPTLDLVAPIEPGVWEVRYVTARSKTVLGRRELTVMAAETLLAAAADVTAGGKFSVTWQGPKNPGDYITVVPRGTPDGQYRNYTDTAKGSPLELTAPIEPGDGEIRYMTGQGAKVLARRAIRVVGAAMSLDAPVEAGVGAMVTIVWTGPKNPGDYITIVAQAMPDGRYGNYTDAVKGSPLTVKAPAEPGAAEIRYVSGQGAKVLARRAIQIR